MCLDQDTSPIRLQDPFHILLRTPAVEVRTLKEPAYCCTALQTLSHAEWVLWVLRRLVLRKAAATEGHGRLP